MHVCNVCMYVCVYVCVYVCMFVYVYAYMYMYMYTVYVHYMYNICTIYVPI